MSLRRYPGRTAAATFAVVLCVLCGPAQAAPEAAADSLARRIAALDLESLLDVKVTLGTRSPEKWFRSASAMYVISGEDIRRSGLTLVPELLRMAPGVHVARIDANKWKIGIRGFNGRFSPNLLVMVDGRIVYTPLFSGVYWDIQDLPIEDIDHIEVVRGPGAALWGSNAVNGIIHIITKHAGETQGGLVSGMVGSGYEKGLVGARYGFGRPGLQVRTYGRYVDHGAGTFPQDGIPDTGGSYAPGADAGDGWRQWHAGFRGDWAAGERDQVSFLGDLYDGEFGQTRVLTSPAPGTVPDTVTASGGFLGVSWQRTWSADADLSLRVFYDHTTRQDAGLAERRDTYTIDLQHRFPVGRHELMWGGEYRASNDRLDRQSSLFFEPPARTLWRCTAFVQDRLDLDASRTWSLTAGAKFEVNMITDFEVQPNLRLLWTPSERAAAWAAVSRAVRVPSRADSDLQLEVMPGTVVSLGNPNLDVENVVAVEVGGRYAFNERFYVDVAAFSNSYSQLIVDQGNEGEVETVGGELSVRCQVAPAWALSCNWSYIDLAECEPAGMVGLPPRHLLGLRSCLDLPRDLALDASLYYTDDAWEDIPAITRLDLRLGWEPNRVIELSLAGLNLLQEATTESRGGTRLASDVPRSYTAAAKVRFGQ